MKLVKVCNTPTRELLLLEILIRKKFLNQLRIKLGFSDLQVDTPLPLDYHISALDCVELCKEKVDSLPLDHHISALELCCIV